MNQRMQQVYQDSAKAVIEILTEHSVSGDKMSCDVPLSILEETRHMPEDMKQHHIFSRMVSAYGYIGVVVPYEYNNTKH